MTTRSKTSIILLAAALQAHAAVPIDWSCDVASPNPRQVQAYRGETLHLACTFVRAGKPFAEAMQTATLYWQTNGMSSLWWQTNAAVTGATVYAAFTPSMDRGAAQYRFFFGASDSAGVNYRANGVIRFADSPGASPNTLMPEPGATINFTGATIVGAPWATLEQIDAALGAYATTQALAGVAATIPELGGYATTDYVDGAVAASASTERATTLADIESAASNMLSAAAALVPSLSGYATETYVRDAIESIPPPDFSPYATRAYADAAASNAQANAIAQIPSLSGYATESYVQGAVSNVPIPSLEGYATEAYANAAASNAQANAIAQIPTLAPYATRRWVLEQVETSGGSYSAGVWSDGYVLDATGVVSMAMISENAIPTPPYATNTTTYIEGGVTTTVETVTTNYTYEVVTNLTPVFKAFLVDAYTSPESAIADAALSGPIFYYSNDSLLFRVSDGLYECNDGTSLEYSYDGYGQWRYSDGVNTYDCIDANGRPAVDISPPALLQWKRGLTWESASRGSVLEAFPLLYDRSGLAPTDYETVSNRAMTALRTESDPTVPAWAKSPTPPLSEESDPVWEVDKPNYATGTALASVSNAAAVADSKASLAVAYLQGEDVRVVITNYDSSVNMPSASIQQQVEDGDSNRWSVVWNELTRWNWLFDNHLPTNYYDKTQMNTLLAEKADRAWGYYDSHTGHYAPDGYTWISSPKIAIAANLAYRRTITSNGEIWILESSGLVSETGGDVTNGFFRISDDEGNSLFEIVKGNKRTVGAAPGGLTTTSEMGVTHMHIPYNVVSPEHPTTYVCTDLSAADWKSEDSAECPANVSWTGSSGAWVAEVWGKSAQPKMFVKAEYEVGGETYIKNAAPMSAEGGILCTDGIHKCRPVYGNGAITWEVVP